MADEPRVAVTTRPTKAGKPRKRYQKHPCAWCTENGFWPSSTHRSSRFAPLGCSQSCPPPCLGCLGCLRYFQEKRNRIQSNFRTTPFSKSCCVRIWSDSFDSPDKSPTKKMRMSVGPDWVTSITLIRLPGDCVL